MDATKKYGKLITDKKEIEGLPATALGLAAQTAVSKVILADSFPIIFLIDPFSSSRSVVLTMLFSFFGYARLQSLKGHENATAENGPWMITLDAPSYLSVMQHARNRSLRKEVYYAYVTRASSGDLDNTEIIDQILKLRLEKAKLLGYNNYAEV